MHSCSQNVFLLVLAQDVHLSYLSSMHNSNCVCHTETETCCFCAQALLTRLEAKVLVRSDITDIHPLMKRLFPKTAKAGAPLERYPARVFLCAYMVLSHPKVVFNTQGELEDMLAAAGSTMLTAFEALLEQLAEPMQVTDRSAHALHALHALYALRT